MFDLNGNVIGINTAIFSPTGGNVGIGFAIPAEQAKPVIDALQDRRHASSAAISASASSRSTRTSPQSLGLPKNRGEIVARVEPGEAAAQGGHPAGRRRREGRRQGRSRPTTRSPTSSPTSRSGTRVPIELIRDGKRQTVTATVGERPPEEQLAAVRRSPMARRSTEPDQQHRRRRRRRAVARPRGAAADPADRAPARRRRPRVRGVVVARGRSDRAMRPHKGLQRGDVILSVNQRADRRRRDDARRAGRGRRRRPDAHGAALVQRGNAPARYVGVKLKAR